MRWSVTVGGGNVCPARVRSKPAFVEVPPQSLPEASDPDLQSIDVHCKTQPAPPCDTVHLSGDLTLWNIQTVTLVAVIHLTLVLSVIGIALTGRLMREKH